MKSPPAVVIPADRPASLGIARSLGKRGISVYEIDADPSAIGMGSRYVRACPLPHADESDENRLNFLMDLGKNLVEKAVLFPVSDDTVMLCSRYRADLQKYYEYVMPEHRTISSLLAKDGLHRAARQHGIPDPQMFQVSSRSEIEEIARLILFPVILKPAFSPAWLKPEIISMLRTEPLSGLPKVALCHNPDELLEKYTKLCIYDSRIIIQEVIPGEDERLLYMCFYLDRQSKPLALFAGKKLRVLPVGFGSATYVRSFHDPAAEQVGLKLLSDMCYKGLGGVEFKKDPRDGCYKLIEFNARFGMWDAFGARCGVDIPYIAYRDTLGEAVEDQTHFREGVYWIDFQRDVRAFLIYRKRGQLSFWRWFRSLWVEKEWAVFAANDWKPAMLGFLELFQRPWNSLKKSLLFFLRTKVNRSI